MTDERENLNGTAPPSSNPANDDDLSLVRRTQEGETEAFGVLVGRYQERIYALAFRMTGNHASADDIAQETFVRAFRGIRRFGGRSSLYTWIYRIALNLVFTHWKKARSRPELTLEPEILEKQADPASLGKDGAGEARSREIAEALERALASLSSEHRSTVVMREMDGLSHEEIARICGCSEGTVRSRLHYAKKILQRKLAKYL
jgi:RNA polymerase sigma-70 factor (ECF subfamily)